MHLAVSVGCPCGIGPEVSVVAARALATSSLQVSLVGDAGALQRAARLRGFDLRHIDHVEIVSASALAADDCAAGAPSHAAGSAQLAAIDRALDLVSNGTGSALVTGPVSKHAIAASGTPFVGHTEYLAERLGAVGVVMCFVGPKLRTSLVTNHLALTEVPRALTIERVAETVTRTVHALIEDFGVARPRVVVCSLNPHAGESGMLGDEERRIIAPALEKVRVKLGDGAVVRGPTGAETAYREAQSGAWDVVVAMYHDQATIASKLLDFGDAVNVTLGLPIVRTSVDHGTGYDIAGRGVADARGMMAAMKLAVAMAERRGIRSSTSE